ncbi:MAG: glycosyltransferase [candidate division FCPU426 bacterium]
MSAPRVSVVIPTFNRRELLGRTLDTLARVEVLPQDLEVIVVDDGSTDDTAAALAARRDPFSLVVLRQERSQGPAAARNQGAAAARGEILGFLDSDVLVDPAWWKRAAPHFDDPAVAGVEGLTRPPLDSGRPTALTHLVANTRGGNFITCNMLYRRSVFAALGGFDRRFLRANREDSDFAFSVLEHGGRIVFEPACIVEHPLFQAPATVYLREARYGLHEALLRRKHPALYRRHLKWIDGRAFPVFFWGVYTGAPAAALGALLGRPLLLAAGLAAWLLGWAGSVYAVCRKRRVRWQELALLIPQFAAVPWLRLFWVLAGEWKYWSIKPETGMTTKDTKKNEGHEGIRGKSR